MTKYLVMMPRSWGIGNSITEADKKARSEGNHGRKKVKRLCFKWDTAKTSDVCISNRGELCWRGDRPERIDLDAAATPKKEVSR